jgi:hypothetical protein
MATNRIKGVAILVALAAVIVIGTVSTITYKSTTGPEGFPSGDEMTQVFTDYLGTTLPVGATVLGAQCQATDPAFMAAVEESVGSYVCVAAFGTAEQPACGGFTFALNAAREIPPPAKVAYQQLDISYCGG